VPEIAAKHGIHHTLVNEWKRALTEGATTVFERGGGSICKTGRGSDGQIVQADWAAEGADRFFVARAANEPGGKACDDPH
jgi:hypothetical protein